MSCPGRFLRSWPTRGAAGTWYIATELCTRSNFVWLAADDPDEGERVTVESIERWSQKGFHRQHYSAMLARVQTALYRGDAEAAWRLLAEQEAMLRRSLLTRVQVLRIESLYLRARSALAMAARNAELAPIPVRGSRRRSPHRQRANAMVRSDCPAAAGRDCVSRGQYSARREIPPRRRRSIRPRRHEACTQPSPGAGSARCRTTRPGASFSDRPTSGWPRSTSRTPPA